MHASSIKVSPVVHFVFFSHASSSLERAKTIAQSNNAEIHTVGDVSTFATTKSSFAVTLGRTHMPALSTSVRALHARARVALPKRAGRNMNVVRAFFGGASKPNAAANKLAFDFTVKDIDGQSVSLSKYAGKVCLVVNVASK